MWRALQITFFPVILAAYPVAAIADDSFLKRELQNSWVCFNSPQELLQDLKSVVPKPILLPEGMSIPDGLPTGEFLINPTEAEKKRSCGMLFSAGDKSPLTIRDFLNRMVGLLGMTWSYDVSRDSIVLDFSWHVSSPQSNAELMETLKNTPDETLSRGSPSDLKNDAWHLAFDALLSKPGNYPKAGQVRWKAKELWHGDELPPVDRLTGTILDETGTAHFLILNVHLGQGLPSVSPVSFYLFSDTGQLEHAGLFYARDGHGRRAREEVDSARKLLIIHNGIDPAYSREDQIFAVEKNRLVFKEGKSYGNPAYPHPPFKTVFEFEVD